MKKSMQQMFKGFSLAEALITLLIVCLITLASIPILTKKRRNMQDPAVHGSFACYWDGDELVSKYIIGRDVINGATVVDDKEIETRIVYNPRDGKPQTVTNSRKGCVFDPPRGAKNFVVTVVGGGGGGAAGYAEDMLSKFIPDGTGSIVIKNEATTDPSSSGSGTAGDATSGTAGDSLTEEDDGEAEISAAVPTGGNTAQFTAPTTAKYQFLVAGAGGGGGSSFGGCGNAGDWPCGGTGTPGAVVVTKPQKFVKGTAFSILTGNYGSQGGDFYAGSPGGDSKVSVVGNESGYFVYAQGGGGGFTPEYDNSNHCKSYQNHLTGNYGIHRRDHVHGSCSSKSTAKGMRSGAPGGYSYNGFVIDRAKYENYIPMWQDFERVGAYLMDENWNLKEVNTSLYGYNSRTGRCSIAMPYNHFYGCGVYAVRNGYSGSRPYRNSLMTRELMQEFEIDGDENQQFPFASGGAGDVSKGFGARAPIPGGRGVVVVKWHQTYGGLGGRAGKVMQIPYSELPSKTRVFPGRGGYGGAFYVYKPHRHLRRYHIGSIPATSGLSSYVKNGVEVLGGEPAVPVSTTDSNTYYRSDDGNDNVGQNGEMASISPTVKTSGGAGGKTSYLQNNYIDNTANLYGLKRTDIFKNGKIVGLFSELVGAGAGGGGGTTTAEYIGNKIIINEQMLTEYVNNNFGKGGDGASGIVFIQW